MIPLTLTRNNAPIASGVAIMLQRAERTRLTRVLSSNRLEIVKYRGVTFNAVHTYQLNDFFFTAPKIGYPFKRFYS